MLGNTSELILTIGNFSTWIIHGVDLVSGFTSPETLQVTINQTQNYSVIRLKQYGNATRKVQQCIGVNLTSPLEIGYQETSIRATVEGKDVGLWTGCVFLNQTYGSSQLLSLTAVRPKVELPVNSTGSIELLFFLNYQLPATEGLTNGSMVV